MREESAATLPARPNGGKKPSPAPLARVEAPRVESARVEAQGPAGRPQRRNAYAALDLGTNNCRLLVAEPASHGFRVIDAFSRIVRLGEGLGSSDRLSEPAIERTLEALRVCRAKMQARGVLRAKIIATEACRLAVNGAEFVERVRSEVGLDLEIVDRQTEAYLAVTGCAALADPYSESVVIFDIGGGSTEIAWLDGAATNPSADPTLRIRAWDSLPVGVVTLAERHGGSDVTRLTFEGMVEEVADLLARFAIRAAPAANARHFHLLGTSGTVTTLAAMHLRLARYERRRVDGLWMSDAEVGDAIDDLLDTRLDQRADNPCIGRDRADLVLAGCAILEAIRRAFPSDRLRIADRGLREGLLMNMMREDGVWRRGSYR
ncbi:MULTISPECIES: Ppx/GppA phosphatase family protein [unclassified Methylobacterium]|uniref:Ppx/GppA phosphatase family protein n=1 Tax=unclassified Methylobacterium TaxID=2615210 RepID=UPI0006FB9542|nr:MULTISPECIES: Ppx/GppA phosphatase family protein [unclassified Methylobacterium]KQP73530.1 exopolyphosphatase [Methylobacterium sp. Leaf113]KQP96530.1 exopolyphosphatase [Methylobacterium sp. Leaf117]MCK2053432.1 Ppx/GppA family phosphatase [Methylobacterium sp. 37f]